MSSITRPSNVIAGVLNISVRSGDAEIERSDSRLAVILNRWLYSALLLVILMTPFEAAYPPLLRLSWITLTNLEVALLFLSALWTLKLMLDPAARARLMRMPLLLPILALVSASVISTLFGEYQAMGGHYIYRLLIGAVVFAVAWECLRSKRRVFTALGAFVAAAGISAVMGLLEFAPLDIEPLLSSFKPQPTTVGGMLRLSGTFEYANGAAMYFEMALPLLLSLVVLFSSPSLLDNLFGVGRFSRARRVAQALLYLLVGLLIVAVLLTFSRASLVGIVVTLATFGMAGVLQRSSRREGVVSSNLLWPLGVALCVMLAAVLYIYLTQPIFRLRLTTEDDRNWFQANITAPLLPALAAGDVLTAPVTVQNKSEIIWRAQGPLSVHVGYHWLNLDKSSYAVLDGARTLLPHDVLPGESVTTNAVVQAPSKPGDYYLQWDLVQEDLTWFTLKSPGIAPLVRYRVGAPVAGRDNAANVPLMPASTSVQAIADTSTISRLQLWKVALSMFRAHPITGVGPDGFRNLYGKYAGVSDWNKNIYTNNTYIEMFTNLGLLGGLAFLWLACVALWRGVRNLLRLPVSVAWIAGLGATAGMLAFFSHGFVDYFLFSTPMYVTFWLTLGLGVCWPKLMPQPSRVAQITPRLEATK
ncbi:MAG: O-antigen ligase family protein [Chloroflexi bacterium]|nr:O-antigen ligase family protein [Chloroflexota bacterium]